MANLVFSAPSINLSYFIEYYLSQPPSLDSSGVSLPPDSIRGTLQIRVKPADSTFHNLHDRADCTSGDSLSS